MLRASVVGSGTSMISTRSVLPKQLYEYDTPISVVIRLRSNLSCDNLSSGGVC